MSDEFTRLAGSFSQGWLTYLLLFLALLAATVVMGWASNRGLRPAERAPLVPKLAFVLAFALLLLVRHVQEDRWNAVIIGVGVAFAAIITARSGTRAHVLPMLGVAALLGFGLNLSAITLVFATVLVMAIGKDRSK